MAADAAGLVFVPDRGRKRSRVGAAPALPDVFARLVPWMRVVLENVPQRLSLLHGLWPREMVQGAGSREPDDDGALALLGQPVVERVENPPPAGVSGALERINDLPDDGALSKRGELPDILENECLWSSVAQNPDDLEDESAASVLQALAVADDAEWLAGKAAEEDVMGRNLVALHFVDVPDGAHAEIALVLRLRALVDVAGEGAAQPQRLRRVVKPPDSAKEVAERPDPGRPQARRHQARCSGRHRGFSILSRCAPPGAHLRRRPARRPRVT